MDIEAMKREASESQINTSHESATGRFAPVSGPGPGTGKPSQEVAKKIAARRSRPLIKFPSSKLTGPRHAYQIFWYFDI